MYRSYKALFEEGRRLDPSYVPLLLNYGVHCEDKGLVEKAASIYEEAIAHAPGAAEPRVNLAGLLIDKGDIAPAAAHVS